VNRPALEVADIVRAQGSRFLDRYGSGLSFQQLKALRAIRNCRTEALGWHIDYCPECDYETRSYNSCRNRNCPKCQTHLRNRWVAAREKELLPMSYFHVVFTMPHELNMLALKNQRIIYNLLFKASKAAAIEVAADPRHLGAAIGMLSILHTWGQNLLHHPHIHCVIPAGGISPNRKNWTCPRYRFFLPVKVLSRVFRGKFIAGLKRLYGGKKLRCVGPAASLDDPKEFSKLIRQLHHQDWVVYAKPAFGGPSQVLRYLGRYTHRVAISNHRLMAFNGKHVTFRWKDYARGSKIRKMKLDSTEFLRRFFLHVLPKGFVRIRSFGFLANPFRSARLKLCRQLIPANPSISESTGNSVAEASTWHCPRCGTPMIIIQRSFFGGLISQGGVVSDTS
jgi:hypothetical protein